MRINEDIKSAWRLALHLFPHLLSAPYSASQLNKKELIGTLHAVLCFPMMFIWLYSTCLKKLCFHKHKPVPFLKHISILRHSHNSNPGLKAQIWKTLTCLQKEQPNLPHICVCAHSTWQKLLRHFMAFDPSHQSLIFLQQNPRIIWQMASPSSPKSCSSTSLQALLGDV